MLVDKFMQEMSLRMITCSMIPKSLIRRAVKSNEHFLTVAHLYCDALKLHLPCL